MSNGKAVFSILLFKLCLFLIKMPAVAVVGKEQEQDDTTTHALAQVGLRGISTKVDEVGVAIQSVSGLLRELSIQLLMPVLEQSPLYFTLLCGGLRVDRSHESQ